MAQLPAEVEARMNVGQAVLRLPHSLSGAYAMAVRLAPQLVMAESDPLRFLHVEKNIQGAAFKLAMYWSTRYNFFAERAFLPMSSSGMGTLTPPDITALWESCIQRLPDDIHGHAVYIIKASTIASSLTSSGTRALFYLLHLSNENGGCILLLVDDSSVNKDDTRSLAGLEAFFGVLSELVGKALPLKVIRVFIISSPLTTPARSMYSERVQLIVQRSLSTQVVVMLNDTSPQELVAKLEPFGLAKAGRPSALGGTFGSIPTAAMADGFSSIDHSKYHVNTSHGSRACTHPSPAEEASSASSSIIQDEEGKASLGVKRRASSFSQKQNGSNKIIREDSKYPRDTGATRHADQEQAVVDETKDTEEDRLKKRNALYSRRKYERKKVEIEVLKKEAHRHRIQNDHLVQEQLRLEQLYANAMKCIKRQELGLSVDDNDGLQQHSHTSILAAASRGSSSPGNDAAAVHPSNMYS